MLPFNRLKKSNTIGNLWVYILLTIKKQPTYGYKIPKIIEEKFKFKPGKITPYRVLYRLEFQGLVERKVNERRKVYKITNKGEEELQKAIDFYKNLLPKLQN